MNAQLRELLREARCPNTFGGHPDPCGWCASRAEAIAALAAPKEAGDGDYLRVMRNLEREYPMDAKVIAAYIARLHDGIRRLAAPSKEAGTEGLHPTHTVERAKRVLGVAAPQADQQGQKYVDGNALGGAIDNAEYARRHAAKPSDQQGASPEGEPPRGWGIAGNYGDGKWRCFREGKPQTYLGNPQATRADAMAECHRLAALSKASPDDQRQEGVDMVPLSVALNAVDHVGSANYESRCREARRWLHEAASAAREGS